jgi:hypothetical protein
MTRTLLAEAAEVAAASTYDTWQTNTHIARTGDAVHSDLMLGNHGESRRNFRIAGNLPADAVGRFEVVVPDGKKYDLRPDLIDVGYDPRRSSTPPDSPRPYGGKGLGAELGLW